MCSALATGLRSDAPGGHARMADPFNLQRFVDAQERVIESVRAELRSGCKRGHWIWFIFPQLKGLGQSATSQMFGISSLSEAGAYLAHPILGPRLVECTRLVNAVAGRSAEQIFGDIDAMKFRSSMTLFAQADLQNPVFQGALEKYYGGDFDYLTVSLLDRSPTP